jgi:hypothetical protein
MSSVTRNNTGSLIHRGQRLERAVRGAHDQAVDAEENDTRNEHVKQLGADVYLLADFGEELAPVAQDGLDDGQAFHLVPLWFDSFTLAELASRRRPRKCSGFHT